MIWISNGYDEFIVCEIAIVTGKFDYRSSVPVNNFNKKFSVDDKSNMKFDKGRVLLQARWIGFCAGIRS